MANLEDVLPAFKNGAKIRRTDWGKGCYIQWHQRNIVTQMENDYKLTNEDIESDKWQLYINEIKLKVTGRYKTRDGRQAFICYFIDEIDRYKGVIVGKASSGSWSEWDEQGKSIYSEDDIVAEWSDDDEG